MTINFFALFFIQKCGMDPIYVSSLAVVTPLVTSLMSLLCQKLRKRYAMSAACEIQIHSTFHNGIFANLKVDCKAAPCCYTQVCVCQRRGRQLLVCNTVTLPVNLQPVILHLLVTVHVILGQAPSIA